jgi:hypothetical protein
MSKIPDTESNIGANSQFGIQQLLGFTAIVAIALVCSFPESTQLGQPNPQDPIWWFVFRFSKLLIGLLCLSGASIVAYGCFAERRFPTEPGRILFLVAAFNYLAANFMDWLVKLLTLDVARDENGATAYFYAFMGVRILSIAVVIGIGIASMMRGRWWWRIAFGLFVVKLLAALAISTLYIWFVNDTAKYSEVYMTLHTASSVLSTIAFLGIIAASIIDFAKTAQRSRLHWLGISCYLLSIFLPWILMMIALQILGVNGLFFPK